MLFRCELAFRRVQSSACMLLTCLFTAAQWVSRPPELLGGRVGLTCTQQAPDRWTKTSTLAQVSALLSQYDQRVCVLGRERVLCYFGGSPFPGSREAV